MRAATRGFTLVELLVVVTLSGLLLVVGMQAWAWQQEGLLSLRSRALRSAEMRLAVEWLRQDLGAAETVSVTPTGRLVIQREPEVAQQLGTWIGSEDAGLVYLARSGYLVRYDAAALTQIPVARMDAMTLSEDAEGLRVGLRLGSGLDRYAVELVWSD